MPGLAIVAPVSFGDTTLPKIDITPLQRVLGATYDWAADKTVIGSLPVW